MALTPPIEQPCICCDCRTTVVVGAPTGLSGGLQALVATPVIVLVVLLGAQAWVPAAIVGLVVVVGAVGLLLARLRRPACVRCGSDRLVPVDTPRGRELAQGAQP